MKNNGYLRPISFTLGKVQNKILQTDLEGTKFFLIVFLNHTIKSSPINFVKLPQGLYAHPVHSKSASKSWRFSLLRCNTLKPVFRSHIVWFDHEISESLRYKNLNFSLEIFEKSAQKAYNLFLFFFNKREATQVKKVLLCI